VRNISIKRYHIYACYTNITLYDVVYSVQYYPRSSVTAVGLRKYCPCIRRYNCNIKCSHSPSLLLCYLSACSQTHMV